MMDASFSHSRTLFLNENGSPLRFYLRPSTAKCQLYPLILHGGGVMCRMQEPDAVLLWDPEESLPPGAAREAEATGSTYISTRYITDCVEHNEKLELYTYRLLEETRVGNVTGSCSAQELPHFQQSGRTAFSQAEDVAILKYLQDYAASENACSGNAIWKEMQQLQLTRHSWQAMRDHYLKQLWHRKDSYKLQACTLNPLSSQCPQQPKNKKEIQTAACSLQSKRETHNTEKEATLQSTTGDHLPAPQLSQEGTCTTGEFQDKVAAEFHKRKAVKIMEDQGLKVQKRAAEEGIRIFEIANQEFEVEDEAELLSPGKYIEREESPELHVMEDTAGPKSVMSKDSAVPDPHQSAKVSSRALETEVKELKRCIQGLMEEFGFSLSVVTQALLKNSGELKATRYFLKNGKRADGYPIWTLQDDLLLEEKDSKVRQKLIKKYGAENVAKQYKFLNC